MTKTTTLITLAIWMSILFIPSCRKETAKTPQIYYIETPYVSLSIDSVKQEYAGQYTGSRLCGDIYHTYFSTLDFEGDYRSVLRTMTRDGAVSNTIALPDTWHKITDTEQALLDSLYRRCGKYILLEDEQYIITSSCKGEFGGKIYFRDKYTDSVYSAHATCPVTVNKLNDRYYITNCLGHMGYSAEIVEIDNPLFFNENTNLGPKFLNKGYGKPLELYTDEGVNLLFDSFTDAGFILKFSFVHKGRLLHFFEDREGTHIGEVENEEMLKRYTWPEKIYPVYGRQLHEGYHFASFSTQKLGEFGFLEITPENIHVRYFTNDLEDIYKIETVFVDIDTTTPVRVEPEDFEELGDMTDTLTIRRKNEINILYWKILAACPIEEQCKPDVRVKMTLYTDRDTTVLYAGKKSFVYKDKTYEVNHSFKSSLTLLPHDKKIKRKYMETE